MMKEIKKYFTSGGYNTIDSVLGFDFDLSLIRVTDDNEEIVLSGGIKSTAIPDSQEGLVQISINSNNKGWFTNYNEGLLAKIRDYKRINT